MKDMYFSAQELPKSEHSVSPVNNAQNFMYLILKIAFIIESSLSQLV